MAWQQAAAAQTYPDKSTPLKIIVPFGAGSAVDAVGRALARTMSEQSGVSALVDNKPGADSIIGMQAVHQAPADGYTMLLVSSSTPVLNPLMVPNQPLNIERDFVPLSTVAKNYPAVVNLGPSTTFKSVGEFIAAAKENPGKYTYASATTLSQLAGQLLESTAGIKLVNVPYKTISAATIGLASGEVDLLITDAGSVRPQWESGRIRPVAIGAPTRMGSLPQIPTMIEEGVPYQVSAWIAVYFDARTPADKAAAMRAIVRKCVVSSGFGEALARFYLEPFDLGGDEVKALTKKDMAMWGKVIRASVPPHAK
ncbi:tripartite tricarboxylate transporter substrate binding protein [Variovorax guangxiensis]|uniref:Bug family tripartite tricarboxylate transporter substrate binding protein n=1 Tax=Variovorax guangxiensis TaxID=1775474 RepID=UPI0028559A99|nr:tripartite tricarboxylate transporter substrate binding protein [Variovorax guangxiensis]MDR6858773.1 tripartite-type tricarboxylate transporter receptor subunit TctC [Variovorax guangxiensis]